MKKIIQIIVFIIILIIILFGLSYIFRPLWNTDPILQEYHDEEPNSLDVLFIGDSDIYNGISPMELYESYGITSYDYASSAASNLLMYYLMLDALKTQNPKIIIMDETSIFGYKEGETNTHRAMDLLPLNDVKISLMNDPNYNFNPGDKLTFALPFFRYHDRWKELSLKDLFKKKETLTYYKGYTFSSSVNAAENEDTYMIDKDETAEFATTYLPESVLKVRDYCQEHNIIFILITMPDTSAWSYAKYEKMISWTKENNITYLDFNVMSKETGVDFSTDTSDDGMHLNTSGACKLSKYIANYLHKHYDLPDHRGVSGYEIWDTTLESYIIERDNYYAELQNKVD